MVGETACLGGIFDGDRDRLAGRRNARAARDERDGDDLAVLREPHRAEVPSLGGRRLAALSRRQILARSSPVLPASGVPDGHFEPFVYTCCFGSPTDVAVSVRPLYCEVNLPSVALVPASAELFGWIWITPAPDE